MKSSLHSQIHFLPFLLSHFRLPSPELNQILGNSLERPYLSLYNSSARATQKTQLLYCWEGLFIDPLPSSGRPIVVRLRFHGNVVTQSLPGNGPVRHNIFDCSLFGPQWQAGNACSTIILLPPCGGGFEYLHRDPSSRRRRRKGKSRIWDSKIWSRVPRDSDPKMTALARSSSNCKGQTRPLVRKGAKNQQTRNCHTSNKDLVVSPRWVLYSKTDWPADRRS
jgi:hypothetical protein